MSAKKLASARRKVFLDSPANDWRSPADGATDDPPLTVRLVPTRSRPAATLLSVFTPSVTSPGDFGIVIVGFVLLTVWRAPPLVVVAVSALGGIGLALAGP